MILKSISLAIITLVLSSNINAATFIEDFSQPFPQWESNWFGLNSNAQNFFGSGSSQSSGEFLWIADDADRGPGETVDIRFGEVFGLSLMELSLDIDTAVSTSIKVFDGSGSILLDFDFNIANGYENIFVSSITGISGFSLFSVNQIEGNTALDNVIATTAVPVPAAIWLLGSGFIGLIGIARRM